MTITATDFDLVRAFVYKQSAIVLDSGKEYLVDARLTTLARSCGLAGVSEVIRELRSGRNAAIEAKIIDAMTTNETSFLRDIRPFDTLRELVMPELIERRGTTRSLRIWSAACSTGQEPYTVAMLLDTHFPELRSWNVKIVATDLSTEALATARSGRYSQIEANRGLPAPWLVKYFERSGMGWQIKSELRQRVDFQPLNLIRQWSLVGKMDLILCRNVLIYFDVETKREIVNRLEQQLAPDGFVFLGSAESMVGVSDKFARIPSDRSGCLRKV